MTNLLLVDASPMTRRFMELTFAREQVRVIAAVDGLKAMDLVRAERPDLVVADHQAAGLSGYELASRLKQEPGLSRIPVLLLAGAYDVVDAERVSSCGCAGVLVKPFKPAETVARVSALIREAALPAPSTPIAAETPIAADNPMPPQLRRVEAAGTLDELFDRLDQLLGKRARPPAQTKHGPPDDPVESDALPTLERLLGSTPGMSNARSARDQGAQPLASDAEERPPGPEAPSSGSSTQDDDGGPLQKDR